MAHKTKQDWLDVAYSSLLEFGVESLSAEKMAAKLGVSRGSFHHHFGSRKGFHHALLDDWVEQNTLRIKRLNEGKTPFEQIVGLSDFAWSLPHKIDVAIRAWALYDDLAKEYQEKTDKLRLDYLTHLFEQEYGKERARKAAEIIFYTFIGMQNHDPDPSDEKFRQFHSLIGKLVESYLLRPKS